MVAVVVAAARRRMDTSHGRWRDRLLAVGQRQLPAYQKCADAFKTANPNVTVKISQFGWDDYWSKITNGFVAGDAPDVFTNHLAKYPEFVTKQQLVPLDATLEKDGFKVDQYQAGLADLWKGQDGKRYGLPKDFDTVALFYNSKMAADGGYDATQLAGLTWNPTDGGTYEKAIAHLTMDANGVRGDEPGFDKDQGQGVRPRAGRRLGRRRRSDPVEHVHRLQQLDLHRQEPVGHQVQLRPAPVPADHRLVLQHDREGLHAASWGRDWSELGRPVRGRQVRDDHQRFLDDQHHVRLRQGGDRHWRRHRSARAASGPACTTAWPTRSGSDRTTRPRAAKWVEFLGSPDCQNIVGEAGVSVPGHPVRHRQGRGGVQG